MGGTDDLPIFTCINLNLPLKFDIVTKFIQYQEIVCKKDFNLHLNRRFATL